MLNTDSKSQIEEVKLSDIWPDNLITFLVDPVVFNKYEGPLTSVYGPKELASVCFSKKTSNNTGAIVSGILVPILIVGCLLSFCRSKDASVGVSSSAADGGAPASASTVTGHSSDKMQITSAPSFGAKSAIDIRAAAIAAENAAIPAEKLAAAEKTAAASRAAAEAAVAAAATAARVESDMRQQSIERHQGHKLENTLTLTVVTMMRCDVCGEKITQVMFCTVKNCNYGECLRCNKLQIQRRDTGSVPAASTWVVAIDPESGEEYFVNTHTGEAQWERPVELMQATPGWVVAVDPESGEEYFVNTHTGEAQWERPAELMQATPGWVVAVDPESGGQYYVDTATGEAQWEIPSELAPRKSVTSVPQQPPTTAPQQPPASASQQPPATPSQPGAVFTTKSPANYPANYNRGAARIQDTQPGMVVRVPYISEKIAIRKNTARSS
jgi:hypothetical protein